MTNVAKTVLLSAFIVFSMTENSFSAQIELSASEIEHRIIGRCFRSDSGQMQLANDGTFTFNAINPRYSYNGRYILIGNGIKSDKGRITRFYLAEDRLYTKLHNSSALVRIKPC